ncbi:sporulation inhibitor of replication protein SirA [Ectobacillus polymachus]|uniref:sporulation inhibitor of replication protein SirA n=1 Tax=Ectobacillus polymachus TaxID=1508806 RepID=UPI003A887D9B
MTTFYLYLIQDEIAKAYVGREHILYDLFSRFVQATSLANRKILYKQIQYITVPMQTNQLHNRVEQRLSFHPHYKRENKQHLLVHDGTLYGSLLIKRSYARIEASNSDEVETMFFEILRKNERSFFAMNFTEKRYGWLNPIKQERKYV